MINCAFDCVLYSMYIYKIRGSNANIFTCMTRIDNDSQLCHQYDSACVDTLKYLQIFLQKG